MIGFLGIGRHDRLRTLLSSYMDGQVTRSEAARVESHLSGCKVCQRDLDNLRATVGLLKALPELELPRSFALATEPEPVRRSWSMQWGGALATAAVAAVLVMLIVGDMTGLIEQTGRVVHDEAVSSGFAAVERESVLAGEPAPAVRRAAPRPAPVAEAGQAVTAPQAAAVAPLAAPAPAVAAVSEPEEGAVSALLATPESGRGEAADAAAAVAAAKALSEGRSGSVEPARTPASDQLAASSGGGEEDGAGIEAPLRQFELAAGALLGLLLAATLGLALLRRRVS